MALLVAIGGIRAIGARTRYRHSPYGAQVASMSQMATMALMIEIPRTALMIALASKAPMAPKVFRLHVTNDPYAPNGSYCSHGSDGSYGAIRASCHGPRNFPLCDPRALRLCDSLDSEIVGVHGL